MTELVGVAILGTAQCQRHAAALNAVDGLHLVDLPGCVDEELLEDPRVGIGAVLTAPEERAYWTQRCLEGGRSVLTAAPVASSMAQARSLAEACRRSSAALQVEAPSLYSGFAADVRGCLACVGVPVYARLRIRVPRSWMASRPESVLTAEGLWAPLLLEELFGRVDSIAAHTRALLRNRPTEDLALAHLEFFSGVEAVLEVHSLGEEDRGTADFELYGDHGRAEVGEDLHDARVVGLRHQYALLRDAVRDGVSDAGDSAAQVERGCRLATWIQQSARLGRRLHRRDL